MIRVNLLADSEFRSDILNTIKGIMRGEFRKVFDDTIKENGWLEKQLALYFEKFDFTKMVNNWCEKNRWSFFASDSVKVLIATAVEQKVNQVLNLLNEKTDQILTEKLKARLGEIDKKLIREQVRVVLKDYNLMIVEK